MIPFTIGLAPPASQNFWKTQVLSPPRSSILSRWWVDFRTDSFLTHPETSQIISSSQRILAPHQSNNSSSFSKYLPLPPPPTHLHCILLPPQHDIIPPASQFFLCGKIISIRKKLNLRWSWWVERIVVRSVSSIWLPFYVFWANKYQNTKTRMRTDLILTYDWQLRSLIRVNYQPLKLNYDSYYANQNV